MTITACGTTVPPLEPAPPDGGVTPVAPPVPGTPALEPPGGVTPEALGIAPERTEFGAVTLEAVTAFKAGGTIETGALNAVELEKSAGVVVGVKLEVEVSVGILEGERLVVVTPKAGVLTLEVAALAMAVLEDGVLVDALETGGVTGVAGGFVTLEDGGVTALALGMPRLVLVGVMGA